VVVATGKRTEIGRIAGAIRAVPKTKMPLQERMDRFGRLVSVAIVLLAGLTLCLGILRGEALSVMFLTAVAIAVSAVPEGLPVVMTITLAVSARRMARRNALVRRLPAVETLGSCTVIATDKTGTMTENRMTVSVVWDGSSRFDFLELPRSRAVAAELAASGEDSALRWTLLAGLLCNEASLGEPIPDGEKVDPDSSASDGAVPTGDPIDIALLDAARRAGLERPVEDRRRPQVNQVPFESSLGWAASVRQDGHELVTLVKGAPERVAEMCGRFLGDASGESFDAEVVRDEAARLGAEGLRVLGMAVGFGAEAANAVLKGGDQPKVLAFAGLVGMIDPPRPEVSEAVAACAAAGIRVIMVTGDHRSTALAVARQTGVVSDGDDAVLAGEELATLSDQELAHLIQRVRVFARVSPHDKLRIVEAMEGVGHVVAVTGDGANDAPALKAAHVGAAMGLRGTDVAKEASDIVLADDHFATVGAAVEEGRNAFANLRNATFFLVSSGAGELMAQILWLNVVTNGVEDVALAVEPPDPRRFRRPPRSPREGILSRRLWERLFLTGLVMAVGTLWIFTTEWGGDPERLTYARVAALTALVVFQVFHVGSCRSEERSVFALSPFSNRFLFFGVGLSLILHIGALYVPVTQTLLQLEPLTLESWARIVAVATTVILAVELHKLVRGDATGSVTA
jgi:Ca2+-transporting ATPase